MAENRFTVIQLPEWDGWRVAGSARDWQIQVVSHGKDGDTWKGVKFYSQLQYAMGEAYEKSMRESGKRLEGRNEWFAECKRVKASLIKAVEAMLK